MKAELLRAAIEEANRFVVKAKRVEIEKRQYSNGKSYEEVKEYTKESSACRRASMDLTRALSQLRRL